MNTFKEFKRFSHHGNATKKGKVNYIRALTREYTTYPIYFKKFGIPRKSAEVKNILAMLRKTSSATDRNKILEMLHE